MRPDELRAWVNSGPSFGELCAAFPAEWEQVQGELATLVARSDTAQLQAYVAKLSAEGDARARGRAAARRDDEALSALVRRQLAITALRKHCLAAATGVTQRQGALQPGQRLAGPAAAVPPRASSASPSRCGGCASSGRSSGSATG